MGNCSGFCFIIMGGLRRGGIGGIASMAEVVGCLGVMSWLSDMYLACSVRIGGCIGQWGGQSGEQLG